MRWTWWHFGALAAVGVALTALSLMLGWPLGGFFLLLPLVFPPLRLGRITEYPQQKRCMQCDFTTREKRFEHCPRDGSKLMRTPGLNV